MQLKKSIAIRNGWLALGAFLWLSSTASACPFCAGGPSGINQVQAGIFNEMFWLRAAAVLAPFPILLAMVALIYFWPQSATKRPNRAPDSTGGFPR